MSGENPGTFVEHTDSGYRFVVSDGEPGPAPVGGTPGTHEEERTGGVEPYVDLLERLHTELRPELYLEIGVRTGRSLRLAAGPAVGVDPEPDVQGELPATSVLHTMTSDEFFARDSAESLLPGPVDLTFIDGMHLFEFALRDFMNVERRTRPGSLVVVDDVLPSHPRQAARERVTVAWTGDIWKLSAILTEHRPDLTLHTVDTAPTGLLLISGLDPQNDVLWEKYDTIVARYRRDLDPPQSVLDRAGVVDPRSAVVTDLLDRLAAARP